MDGVLDIRDNKGRQMELNTEQHCHYSGLPAPAAYDCDYDGMGNQGRCPRPATPKPTVARKIISLLKEIFPLRKQK